MSAGGVRVSGIKQTWTDHTSFIRGRSTCSSHTETHPRELSRSIHKSAILCKEYNHMEPAGNNIFIRLEVNTAYRGLVHSQTEFWKSPGIPQWWSLSGLLLSAVWVLADPAFRAARLTWLHWFSLLFLLGTFNSRFLDRYGFYSEPLCQTDNYKYTQMHIHSRKFKYAHSMSPHTQTCRIRPSVCTQRVRT